MAQILELRFNTTINLKLNAMKNAKNTIKNTRILDYLIALIVMLTFFGIFPEYSQQNSSTVFILTALVVFESTKFISKIFRYFFVKQYFNPPKKQVLSSKYVRADFGAHISTFQKEFDMSIKG